MTCLAYLALLGLLIAAVVMLFIHPLLTLLALIFAGIIWHGIYTAGKSPQ